MRVESVSGDGSVSRSANGLQTGVVMSVFFLRERIALLCRVVTELMEHISGLTVFRRRKSRILRMFAALRVQKSK